MAKKVLLTTMSVLKSIDRVNYYFARKDGKRFFVSGISSLEQGSKYVLSLDSIDRIVVVGTKETIDKDVDRTEYDNLLADEVWPELEAGYERVRVAKNKSAYAFYKYRIAQYLREKGGVGEGKDRAAVDVVNAEIATVRKKELEQMYEEICQGKNPFESTDEDIWKEIDKKVTDAIEACYTAGEYALYRENVEKIEARINNYLAGVKDGTIEGNFCQRIAQDKELSLLEKQYIFVSVREALADVESQVAGEARAKLEKHYNILHNRRRNMETAYLRYYAYCNLREEDRMPLMPFAGTSEERKLELVFVDEQIGEEAPIDNVNGVVNAVLGEGKENIDLYIDMQGGNRTSGYVRHAMVSILHNQKPSRVHIKMIIGTNFNELQNGAGEIANETGRYGILDLLSGMNAFVQYGKADMIQKYYQDRVLDGSIDKESSVGKLVATMGDVDDAISLCNINALADAIKALRTMLNVEVQPNSKESTFVENVFMILRDGIRKDYGALLDSYGTGDDLDYLELISWCSRKGFLQQALTLIEDKMPELYFKEKVLRYQFRNNQDQNNFKKCAGQSYEKRIENKLFYSLPFNVVGGPILDMLWITKGHTPAEKAANSSGWQSELQCFLQKKQSDLKYFRDYLISQLTDSSVGISSDRWKVVRPDVERTAESLKETTERESLVTKYCLFRMLEKAVEEEQYYHDITTPGMFYRVVRNKMKRNGVETFYYSILWYLGEKEYEYKTKQKVSGQWKQVALRIPITLSIPMNSLQTPKAMELLDRMFLLHEALKQERNCSNHASTKGIRLPSEVVKRAINAYVSMMREVRDIIEGIN